MGGNKKGFSGLVLLVSITKEKCYRDLDVLTRHYNKSGFYVKHIECNDEFKSIMDEVSDEIGIYINYSNADGQVPEAEINNRVIK